MNITFIVGDCKDISEEEPSQGGSNVESTLPVSSTTVVSTSKATTAPTTPTTSPETTSTTALTSTAAPPTTQPPSEWVLDYCICDVTGQSNYRHLSSATHSVLSYFIENFFFK